MQTISKKSQEMGLCSFYTCGPESVPSLVLHHSHSIPFQGTSAHPDKVLHACSQYGWWINFITLSGIHGSRRPEGPFNLKEKYLYLHYLWKIYNPLKNCQWRRSHKICILFASFIFLNIFLMCNLHFPWWLNWLMWSDFFLSYKYKWWHSHWPHHTILQTK